MSEMPSGQPKTSEHLISPEIQKEIDRLAEEMNTSLKQAKSLESLPGNENISSIKVQPLTTRDFIQRKQCMLIVVRNSGLTGLLESGKIDLETLRIILEVTDEMVKFVGS